MAVKLNRAAYDYALSLIKNGLEVETDSGNWDEVKPTQDEILHHLGSHDLDEYGLWYLGIDTDADQNDKSKYIYPYGDLKVVHQSALVIAEQEAANNGHHEIRKVAQELLSAIKKSQQ